MRILLLHPLGGGVAFWEPLVEWLSDSFQIVRCDFPGHGSSPTVRPGRSVVDLADDLARALGPAEPLHVVGISFGGLVAQQLAARHPHLVDHLILTDTVVRYPEQMRHSWTERAAIVRVDGVEPLIDATVTAWLSPKAAQGGSGLPNMVADLVRGCDPEGYALTCETLASVDTEEAMKVITAPTMIVCGDGDGPAFVDAALVMAATIPGAQLRWMRGARHAGPLEMPDVFAGLVRGFLPVQPN